MCRTRLNKASILESSKQPILLPTGNRYVLLLIQKCRSTNTRSDVDLFSSSEHGQATAQLPVSTPPHLPQQVAMQPQSQVNNRPKRNAATIGEQRRQGFKH